GGLARVGLVRGDIRSKFHGGLAHLPVAMTVLSPVGEVLLSDGTAIEFFGEEGFDFRQRIEPGEEGGGWFFVLQAAVELLAQGARQASDFSNFHMRALRAGCSSSL